MSYLVDSIVINKGALDTLAPLMQNAINFFKTILSLIELIVGSLFKLVIYIPRFLTYMLGVISHLPLMIISLITIALLVRILLFILDRGGN